jgi:hypothetical protein
LSGLKCFSCGKEISAALGISRRDECVFCHSDVHVCKNCQFYDSSVYNECRESQAEVVREKDRANFCDFFQAGSSNSLGKSSAAELLASAEALFKKKI